MTQKGCNHKKFHVERRFKENHIYWVMCQACGKLWRIFTPDNDTTSIQEFENI